MTKINFTYLILKYGCQKIYSYLCGSHIYIEKTATESWCENLFIILDGLWFMMCALNNYY